MISFLYFLGSFLYCFAIHIASFFNPKARQWVSGRKNWKQNLTLEAEKLKGKVVWIHCSSLGEFEQARPLVDGCRNEISGTSVVVSFFSPSGYNIRKNYKNADLVVYLPCDVPGNASFFITTIHPGLAIFVKYDLWYGYLKYLKNNAIPSILVSVVQHKPLGSTPGGMYKKLCFSLFNKIYVQDEISQKNIHDAIQAEVDIAGDTRIDSVLKFAAIKDDKLEQDIPEFTRGQQCLICGSTWPDDESLLLDLMNDELFRRWKAIIAPHEMKQENLERLKDSFHGKALFYSRFDQLNETHQVLIIDSIGFLSKLYRYGDLAYIGGGFGKGIHNTLEPAAFGLPVIFGPRYRKFTEAVTLVDSSAFISIQDAIELKTAFMYYNITENRDEASKTIQNFLQSNRGASEKILSDIKSHYLNISK